MLDFPRACSLHPTQIRLWRYTFCCVVTLTSRRVSQTRCGYEGPRLRRSCVSPCCTRGAAGQQSKTYGQHSFVNFIWVGDLLEIRSSRQYLFASNLFAPGLTRWVCAMIVGELEKARNHAAERPDGVACGSVESNDCARMRPPRGCYFLVVMVWAEDAWFCLWLLARAVEQPNARKRVKFHTNFT